MTPDEEGRMKKLSALAKPFELDYRSLAAFRIALAAMLLFDLAIRFADIGAFLTDGGVLPREAMLQRSTEQFSLHLMTGSWWGQALLLGIHAWFAAMLLVGKRTRLAAVACWTLLISLQARNELILHGGDHYLKVLFLWAIFLPLDGAWSIDTPPKRNKTVSSGATFCLLVQMGVVYWCAASLKTGPEWLRDNSALYYAFSISYFKLPLSEVLLRFPTFLEWLTRASLWWEWLGPLGFFMPIRFTRVRLFTFVAFFAFHLGIAATLYLGTLPYVFIIPLFVLIPPPAWKVIEPIGKRGMNRVRGYFEMARAAWLPWQRQAARALPALLMVFVGGFQLVSNFETLKKRDFLPNSLRWMVATFRLDQDWGMFAPYPYKSHGWYVIEALDFNGQKVSVIDREPAAEDDKARPWVTNLHRNGHWLAYSILVSTEHLDQLEQYAAYLCRKGPRTAEVRMAFMRLTTPPTPDIVKAARVPLVTRRCDNRAPASETPHAR